MERIFIVEDEPKLREEMVTLLERNGYRCSTSEDYVNIISTIEDAKPDLVLLDINLPIYDGFYICKELRQNSDIPIIVVTSNKSDIDELLAMNLGADDFVNKPFNLRILLAHIGSVLKRAYGKEKDLIITHNDVKLDILKSILSYKGKSIELTRTELGILKLLIENKGNIVPRNEIIRNLWEMEEFVEDNTLTVNVNRIRRKLEDIGLENYLITRRGQGYMVVS
ncbi:response regulator [Paeniclostridium sordellii]|uniref:response regulator transcription factor n=1 Tax=Paraclostridium sordellii TaxID=1505 RepID=UPI0012B010C2|nr:response regulator transcription factor [Paeniclostridium sordellii]MDU4412274.1 response regulator transcription factor [Paeniclostridium sordellii]MRZ30407.1 response regulator [Paeniclostridium sordellii]